MRKIDFYRLICNPDSMNDKVWRFHFAESFVQKSRNDYFPIFVYAIISAGEGVPYSSGKLEDVCAANLGVSTKTIRARVQNCIDGKYLSHERSKGDTRIKLISPSSKLLTKMEEYARMTYLINKMVIEQVGNAFSALENFVPDQFRYDIANDLELTEGGSNV